MTKPPPRLGLVSDTHDLLRPEVIRILQDCEVILHAGDICRHELLESLQRIGPPVVAVRGNNDHDDRLADLPDSRVYDWRGVRILLIHDRLEITTIPPDIDVIVHGHSHKPRVTEEGGRVYVNPGSCGRRRFRNPISLATLEIDREEKVRVEIHEIDPQAGKALARHESK